mgnify:CR=1 FL=1
MVNRDIKEALNLVGVEIHGEDPVGAGAGDQVGHQLGGDGVAALGLAVLTGVTVVRDDRRDGAGGGGTALRAGGGAAGPHPGHRAAGDAAEGGGGLTGGYRRHRLFPGDSQELLRGPALHGGGAGGQGYGPAGDPYGGGRGGGPLLPGAGVLCGTKPAAQADPAAL